MIFISKHSPDSYVGLPIIKIVISSPIWSKNGNNWSACAYVPIFNLCICPHIQSVHMSPVLNLCICPHVRMSESVHMSLLCILPCPYGQQKCLNVRLDVPIVKKVAGGHRSLRVENEMTTI